MKTINTTNQLLILEILSGNVGNFWFLCTLGMHWHTWPHQTKITWSTVASTAVNYMQNFKFITGIGFEILRFKKSSNLIGQDHYHLITTKT